MPFLPAAALLAALPLATPLAAEPPPPTPWTPGSYFPPSLPDLPPDRLTPLLLAVDTARLRAFHDLLASEPHVAGTPGDLRQADRIAAAFADMGLEVEKHEFFAYLARPTAAVLELIAPGRDGQPERKPLILKETILPEDADSASPDLTWGWNAYSGSGDITAPVVYANHGTKEDFEKLKDLGVDVSGRIALCRYGGNFRGQKVRFAQAAGAAGVIIFTDPGKPEEQKTPAYPRGGAPNDTCIERGSVNTLDYPGDPLTPGVESTRDARRLDPAEVALPRIPVQPIGWGAARDIFIALAASDDKATPPLPDGWQGGLPVPYRLVGPRDITLRLKVEQVRETLPSFNIIGTLRGSEKPDEWVLVGSHHDAWGFGACDPTCGTICTMEAARVFAQMAKSGRTPRRTLKFCCWGAEEFGIIGSTEWVESRRDELEAKGVAYLNLDMAAMGPNFAASAAPALKTLLTDITRRIPAVGATLDARGRVTGPTVFDTWITRSPDPALPGQPAFGDLGGGSDHVAFWCHAGVPSAGLSCGGTPGSAYHSVYDTLAWYRKNVGEDYQPARMLTQVVVAALDRLAGDQTPPLDQARIPHDFAQRLATLADLADKRLPAVAADVRALILTAREAAAAIAAQPSGPLAPDLRAQLMAPSGLPTRIWYRNEQAAPDMDSGYAAWPLPRLSQAIEHQDVAAARAAVETYRDLLERLRFRTLRLDTPVLRPAVPPAGPPPRQSPAPDKPS